MQPLKYPTDLDNAFVTSFSCTDNATNTKSEVNILLPMPNGGLAFADGGQYSEVDLGFLGANQLSEESKEGILKRIGTTTGDAGIKSILLNTIPGAGEAKLASGNKTLLAPNTNTSFTNNTVRSFTFAYKLSPRNLGESNVIKAIDDAFRELTYASNMSQAAKVLLQFPPTWRIRFLSNKGGDSASENDYLPKIADCYLTSYNSNFNASGNLYHADGQPTEVDISLTFQETRVQTREDINALSGRNQTTSGIGAPAPTAN